MDYVAALATITLKAAGILAAALIANRALRSASAAARHLVWIAAFIALATAAVAEFRFSHIELPSAATAETALTLPAMRGVTVSPATPPSQGGWPVWMFAAWMGGVALTASRLLFSLAMASSIAVRPALVSDWFERTQRLRQQLAIRRDVELLLSHDAAMPMTWGAFHPVVILPRSAVTWTHQQLDMVLAHELAHVKRWDWMTQLLGYGCCAFYWFFPPVWLALHQSRKERERACDDIVLRLGARATDYADHLVRLARSVSRLSWSGAVAMAQESHLENRVTAMLDKRTNRAAVQRTTLLSVGVAVIACLIPLARLTLAPPRFEGVVLDASGAVVPEATVALISHGLRYTTVTAADGGFRLLGLPSGVYELQATHTGFRRFRQADISLSGGRTYRIRPVLTVGLIHESLTVTAD